MKAWKKVAIAGLWNKGAAFGFISGFIYWVYVLLPIWNNPQYQFTKYSVASYSFFYGVVLVGVLSGVLFHIWSKVDRRITLAGLIWVFFSFLWELSKTHSGSIAQGMPLHEPTIFEIFITFPAWISGQFFKILPHYFRGLPGGIDIPSGILLLLVTGPLSLILLKNICFSIIRVSCKSERIAIVVILAKAGIQTSLILMRLNNLLLKLIGKLRRRQMMKAWEKGAIAGFVLGFIYWVYVVTEILPYQPIKYSVVFYSFFFGVVLVGVLSGVLSLIWSNVDRRIRIAGLIFGSIWGLFSVIGFIPPCLGTIGQGCPEPEYSILHNLLFFPAWISGQFLKILPHYSRGLPGYIDLPSGILLLIVTGSLICILFIRLTLSIGYLISKLIGRVRTK